MSDRIEEATHAGLAWLRSAQQPSGEFPSFASALTVEPTWEADRLNFVTALTSLALEHLTSADAMPMRERVATYLLAERSPSGLWRYWARTATLHDYTPLDADDTACCSMAVGLQPQNEANTRLLLANRDDQGRFYTWFLLRPGNRSLRYRIAIRDERSSATQARREDLWANSEAAPNDVDVVVNANVIRYLGPRLAPTAAVEWVATVIERGSEVEDDKWYRSRTSLYRAVAAAAAVGVARFGELRKLIIERIVHDPGTSALRNDLEVADALRVLRVLDAPYADVEDLAHRLLERQTSAGSWERSICYYGGPKESFGWASEALATATAIGALDGVVLQGSR